MQPRMCFLGPFNAHIILSWCLFQLGDCAASLCLAGTANCLCYLWWIVKDVKPTRYAFAGNLDCSLLWQNRTERECFLSQLEVSKGLWIMCDGVEDNEGCWDMSERCCRICQTGAALKKRFTSSLFTFVD